MSNKRAEKPGKKKWWQSGLFHWMLSLLLASSIASLIFCTCNPQTCPSRYDEFLPHRGQCYHISEENLTWLEAQSICKKDGGFLLEIYTESEWDHVKKMLNFSYGEFKQSKIEGFWLGANDSQLLKSFIWTQTGLPPYNIQWAKKNFPSGVPSVTCLFLLRIKNFTWSNTNCESRLNYICKLDLGHDEQPMDMEILQNSTDNSNNSFTPLEPWATEAYSGGSEFMLISPNKNLNWSDARSLCKSHGMDLVVIDIFEKYFFIFTQVYNKFPSDLRRYWLGATRESSAKSQFEINWLNGKTMNWSTNFWPIMEENRSNKCVSILRAPTGYDQFRRKPFDHVFYLTDCDETYHFQNVVCEKSTPKQDCSSNKDCHPLAKCIEVHFGGEKQKSCVCNSGYDGDGSFCFDIDECRLVDEKDLTSCWKLENLIRTKKECRNTVGSYNCSDLDQATFRQNWKK